MSAEQPKTENPQVVRDVASSETSKLPETAPIVSKTVPASKASSKHKKKYRQRRPDDPPFEQLPKASKPASTIPVKATFEKKFKYVPKHYEEMDDDNEAYQDYERYEQPFTPYSGWYMNGNGDPVYQTQGEMQDYTACSMECGYCGRCDY